MNIKEFRRAAKKGELDFYTCIALSSGRHKGHQVLKFIPKLLSVLILQLVVGVLCIITKFERGVSASFFYPSSDAANYTSFRLLAGILFAYSCSNLIDNMQDECRDMLIRYLEPKKLLPWYDFPLLFGEVMNTTMCLLLMMILYLVFCQTSSSENLLMNCIAINFVGGIDNEFVGEEELEGSVANLEASIEDLENTVNEETFGDQVVEAMFGADAIMRYIVVGLAFFLGGFLTFAHHEPLCHRMQDLSPWPFCVGIAH
jgi:hypothetical protein